MPTEKEISENEPEKRDPDLDEFKFLLPKNERSRYMGRKTGEKRKQKDENEDDVEDIYEEDTLDHLDEEEEEDIFGGKLLNPNNF